MATIAPAILTDDFDTFVEQLRRVEQFFDYVQIDVMDGKFVEGKSFPEIQKLADLKSKSKFELHLMVEDPLAEMEKWKNIKNVFRVIFHIEAAPDPRPAIAFARKQGWEVGLVLNPDTSLAVAEPYFPLIDVLQFMTVYPGKQGQPFVPEVVPKIKEFCARKDRPLCAVDGAINTSNIGELAKLGVEIFNIGSALTRAPDVAAAYAKLQQTLLT